MSEHISKTPISERLIFLASQQANPVGTQTGKNQFLPEIHFGEFPKPLKSVYKIYFIIK